LPIYPGKFRKKLREGFRLRPATGERLLAVTAPSSVTYYFSDRGGFRLDDTSTDLGVNWYAPPLRGVRFFIEGDIPSTRWPARCHRRACTGRREPSSGRPRRPMPTSSPAPTASRSV
jgi:hypothetical protein